jgi:hypothetical protein
MGELTREFARREHRLRVSENRVLKRKFGPKRKEAAEGCGSLNNDELHNFNTSPHVTQVIKSRRIR